MTSDQLSLRADAAAVYGEHRAGYLAGLVAPMDDMWATFADYAAPHALLVGNEVAGSCCVDADARLLRFHVLPRWQHRSVELLRLALAELGVAQMIVFTQDPSYLCAALDVASSVEPHTLLFAALSEPEVAELEGLVEAGLDDHERIVAFEVAEVGMPRGFLDGYVRERLERREILLHEEGGRLVGVAELRRDRQQAGIAQLGVIVHREARGRGLGSRLLTSLVARSREEGLTPICSTEVANPAARRAIERAGFRAHHRVLQVGFEL